MHPKEKLEEISLLLVMTDGSDTIGVETLIALLEELKAAIAGQSDASQVQEALAELLAKQSTLPGPDFVTEAGHFVSQSQAFFENVGTPNFAPKAKSASSEFGANFDQEFLAEFIEKHSLLLEDFEGELVSFRFKTDRTDGDIANLRQYCRKYLHNIKGDAGSIGLQGIERVTHILEDVAETLDFNQLIDTLLS